jgi:predicted aspartyl protease
MVIVPLELSCKKFQESFSARLQKAGNDAARFRLYTAGLLEFSRKILPMLQALGDSDGLVSKSYQQGQQAASNLLQTLATPYLRSCQDFNAGVMLFAGLISACDDPVLKRRLVAYSNHLKTEWNKIEPSGLSHNPRAAKRRNVKDRSESQSYIGIGLFLLMLLSGAAIFSGPSSRTRPMAEMKRPLTTPVASIPTPVAATTSQPRAPQIELPASAPIPRNEVSGVYRYADAQGGIHFADQLTKVPVEYRETVKFTSDGSGERSAFKVQIVGNHVLVPVTLRNEGNSVTALLLLDTGCSMTTITEELAGRLNIDNRRTWSGTARVADGRMISTRLTKIDQMLVGSRSLTSAEISIMPHSGAAQRHDGLLGMNFLRQHRYQVDYDNGLIRWQ